jgi:hypothetical protein
MSTSSNNRGWAIVGLLILGLIFGVGPFRNAQCTSDNSEKTNYSSQPSSSQPSFTGDNSYRKYKCSVPGCLCTKYEKKSTYNLDCVNCGHRKDDHYEFK